MQVWFMVALYECNHPSVNYKKIAWDIEKTMSYAGKIISDII